MKARVYGWAVESGNKGFIYCNGCVQEFSDKACVGDWCVFYADGMAYSVHDKQIEPIKEITITEEEFDYTFNLVLSKHKECGFTYDMRNLLNEFKEELFKDLK